MDTKQIKQLAVDVNNVAEASFQSGKEHVERPLLVKIDKLTDQVCHLRKMFDDAVIRQVGAEKKVDLLTSGLLKIKEILCHVKREE